MTIEFYKFPGAFGCLRDNAGAKSNVTSCIALLHVKLGLAFYLT